MSAFLDNMETRLADDDETFTSAEVLQLIDELMDLAAEDTVRTVRVQTAFEQAQAQLQAIRERYSGGGASVQD